MLKLQPMSAACPLFPDRSELVRGGERRKGPKGDIGLIRLPRRRELEMIPGL